jgi:tetratricopeptide (TPR) repeat protein
MPDAYDDDIRFSLLGASAAEPRHLLQHGAVPVGSTALPDPPPGFTGRDDEVARLLTLIDPSSQTDPRLVMCVVSGPGGVGTTATAVSAAHEARAKGWFPGGILFVSLRGYRDSPVTADQAVLALLDALGVRGSDLPRLSAAHYGLYRTLLAERREPMLLVFDDASDADHIIRLLPGTARHRVLITSRDRLAALEAWLVELAPFSTDAAVGFVTSLLHPAADVDKVPEREHEALRELGALCGGLPLALKLAAGMLRQTTDCPIASLVAELHATTEPGRVLGVRRLAELAYAKLPGEQARMLRFLALAPGPDISTESVAAMAGLPAEHSLAALLALSAAGLLELLPASAGSIRCRLHDLVRAHAAAMADAGATAPEETEAAQGRLLAFYRQRAEAADSHMRWVPGQPVPDLFADRGQALAWMDEERSSLVEAVQWVSQDRHAPTAIALALTVTDYLLFRGYVHDAIQVGQAAQQGAHRTGDREQEAMAWTRLGGAFDTTARTEEAIEAHTRARTVYEDIGDRGRQAAAANSVGITLHRAGRNREAVDAFNAALLLHQELDDWYETGSVLHNLALLHDVTGDPAAARGYWVRAAEAFERAHAPTEAAEALNRAESR